MTILITRPSNKGEQLTKTLNTLGLTAYHTPIIKIESGRELSKLPGLIATLSKDDFIFALSPNAVEYAQQQNIDWPTDINYVAIGRASANRLAALCHQSVSYPDGTEISENLLSLPILQNIEGRRVIILRGNGGRELIGNILTARGAKINFCECYQRIEIEYNPDSLIRDWQIREINTIVVTSNEILQRLYQLVNEKHRHWLLNCKLFVVSERIARHARQLGWHKIIVAESANNQALITALQQAK